jgi:hypothetical protein
LLDSLVDVLLTADLLWHPSARTLDDFLGVGAYEQSSEGCDVPLDFGFGPSLIVKGSLVQPNDPSLLIHKHVVYEFPPTKSRLLSGSDETHAVLPLVLANPDPEVLMPLLDRHLGDLVDGWFPDFPLYDSKLNVLGWIYTVYQRLENVRFCLFPFKLTSKILIASVTLVLTKHVSTIIENLCVKP